MATVPRNNLIPQRGVDVPSPEHLLMAAATMHELGRLLPRWLEPETTKFEELKLQEQDMEEKSEPTDSNLEKTEEQELNQPRNIEQEI